MDFSSAPAATSRDSKIRRAGFFVGAVLLHLVGFLMLATLVIWKAPALPATSSFEGAQVKIPLPQPQPPSSGSAASNPQFEPEPTVVPMVTPPTVITSSSSLFNIDSPKVLDQALSHMASLNPKGSGIGNAGGGGSSGNGSGYGTANGGTGGLQGTIYDLKQTLDRKPTNIAENDVELHSDFDMGWPSAPATQKGLEVLRAFAKTWNTSLLSDYFKGPHTLSTSQICIPVHPSVDAPKAFGVQGIIRARRWIVLYHARIIPPSTGRYRFIGYGDDFLIVRYDGQNVLDGSLTGEELDTTVNTKEDVGTCEGYGPYRCGPWIQMEEGLSANIDVLIGEGPGGASGFIMMIQKEGDLSPKGDYPVFQLHDEPIPDGTMMPPSKKKIIFKSE